MKAKVVAVFHLKGGVGKSSVAFNLAHTLAQNQKVLAMDLDPQASLSLCFDEFDPEGPTLTDVFQKRTTVDKLIRHHLPTLDVLPTNLGLAASEQVLFQSSRREERLGRILAPVMDQYQAVVIDAAPSLSLLNTNLLAITSHLVIPVIPDYLGVHSLKVLWENLEKLQEDGVIADLDRIRVLIVPNLVDYRGSITQESLDALAEFYPDELVDIQIPISQWIRESTLSHRPLLRIPRAKRIQEYFSRIAQAISPPPIKERFYGQVQL